MKEKYDIEIAGLSFTVVSDEEKEVIEDITRILDERIRDLTVRSKRASKLDAALLCAIDYCTELQKSEKKLRNLEAQIALYEANIKRYRDENTDLKSRLNELSAEPLCEENAPDPCFDPDEVIPAPVLDADEAPALEEYMADADGSAPVPEDGSDAAKNDRREQLRRIENLLRNTERGV